jgi:lauroyl/myristoyl acyltransferase
MTTETKLTNKNFWEKLKPNLITFFKVGMRITPLVPVAFGNFVCDLIGLLGYYFVRSRRKAALCNLSYALADISLQKRRKIARAMFKSNIRNYYDILRVRSLSYDKMGQSVEVLGLQENWFDGAINGGKGVICFGAHTGSFSFATNVASHVGIVFNLLVEPIKPPELYELIRQQRAAFPDSHMIPVGGTEIRQVFRALKRNEFVCLAIDRDVLGTGKPVKFFGKETNLPLGAAELAIKTGALVMAVHPYRENGKSKVRFYPGFYPERTGDNKADAQKLMERMVGELEKIIRTTPQDWVALSPIWNNC